MVSSYGRTTIAESKMMFYPTDRIEQYRLFFFLTDLGRVENTTKKLVESIYGQQYQIDAINQLYVPNLLIKYLSKIINAFSISFSLKCIIAERDIGAIKSSIE